MATNFDRPDDPIDPTPVDPTDPYARTAQTFPVLTDEQIQRARGLAQAESLPKGTILFERGQRVESNTPPKTCLMKSRGQQIQVQSLGIPSGLVVYLKEFGWVKVFSQEFKNEARYYILWRPELDELKTLTRERFKQVHNRHWQIESFHRVIKQVCNIERFQLRNQQAIRNHFFCALRAFDKLQTMRVEGLIDNLYQVSRQLFIPVIRQFILNNCPEPAST